MTRPDEITPFEKRLVETHLSQVPFGMDADKYHRIAHEIENRKEAMPDATNDASAATSPGVKAGAERAGNPPRISQSQ